MKISFLLIFSSFIDFFLSHFPLENAKVFTWGNFRDFKIPGGLQGKSMGGGCKQNEIKIILKIDPHHLNVPQPIPIPHGLKQS